ncbi:unnamed protein product [Merluccius merluccius]
MTPAAPVETPFHSVGKKPHVHERHVHERHVHECHVHERRSQLGPGWLYSYRVLECEADLCSGGVSGYHGDTGTRLVSETPLTAGASDGAADTAGRPGLGLLKTWNKPDRRKSWIRTRVDLERDREVEE